MRRKGIDNVVHDALTYKRAHRIVEYKVDVLVAVGLYGRKRRVVTLLAALKYLLNLAPLVAQHDVLEVAYEHWVSHNGYLVDALVALEHVDSVLHHHLACHLEKLFWGRHSEARTRATGKYNGYISFHTFLVVLFAKIVQIEDKTKK